MASSSDLTKLDLFKICYPYHYQEIFSLETIAKEVRGDNVKILCLPVAYCKMNPIEFIQAYVKNCPAKYNSAFKLQDVQQSCMRAVEKVDDSSQQKCIKYAEKGEERNRSTEGTKQVNLESIIIRLGEDDNERECDEQNDEDYNDNGQNKKNCNQ